MEDEASRDDEERVASRHHARHRPCVCAPAIQAARSTQRSRRLLRDVSAVAGVEIKTFPVRNPTKKADIPAAPTPQVVNTNDDIMAGIMRLEEKRRRLMASEQRQAAEGARQVHLSLVVGVEEGQRALENQQQQQQQQRRREAERADRLSQAFGRSWTRLVKAAESSTCSHLQPHFRPKVSLRYLYRRWLALPLYQPVTPWLHGTGSRQVFRPLRYLEQQVQRAADRESRESPAAYAEREETWERGRRRKLSHHQERVGFFSPSPNPPRAPYAWESQADPAADLLRSVIPGGTLPRAGGMELWRDGVVEGQRQPTAVEVLQAHLWPEVRLEVGACGIGSWAAATAATERPPAQVGLGKRWGNRGNRQGRRGSMPTVGNDRADDDDDDGEEEEGEEEDDDEGGGRGGEMGQRGWRGFAVRPSGVHEGASTSGIGGVLRESTMVVPPTRAHPSGGGSAGGGGANGNGNGNGNANGGMSNGARQAAEDAGVEDSCPICMGRLPDTGRGVTPCGHVFCFTCIFKWGKKDKQTAPRCPTCRDEFKKLSKTLTPEDIAKEQCRQQIKKESLNKNPSKHHKKRASNVKTPVPGVMVKTVRLRFESTKKKKKPSANSIAQHFERQRLRLEQERLAELEEARRSLAERAAEAQRYRDEAVERARTLRARANRSEPLGQANPDFFVGQDQPLSPSHYIFPRMVPMMSLADSQRNFGPGAALPRATPSHWPPPPALAPLLAPTQEPLGQANPDFFVGQDQPLSPSHYIFPRMVPMMSLADSQRNFAPGAALPRARVVEEGRGVQEEGQRQHTVGVGQAHIGPGIDVEADVDVDVGVEVGMDVGQLARERHWEQQRAAHRERETTADSVEREETRERGRWRKLSQNQHGVGSEVENPQGAHGQQQQQQQQQQRRGTTRPGRFRQAVGEERQEMRERHGSVPAVENDRNDDDDRNGEEEDGEQGDDDEVGGRDGEMGQRGWGGFAQRPSGDVDQGASAPRIAGVLRVALDPPSLAVIIAVVGDWVFEGEGESGAPSTT
eukprot:g9001.t1